MIAAVLFLLEWQIGKNMLFDKYSMNDPKPLPATFNGLDYVHERDCKRLTGQINRVFNCMKDSRWRTLDEIHCETGDPHASISAQLRHLRKKRFGGFIVNKRNRGRAGAGLFEYQLKTEVN